jgi:2-polyprenyl-6-methoxyphenol hydroxylase-like FAD-dependent oxidoreductase
VLVVGRGIAGTTSAWLLARSGFPVVLAGPAPRGDAWVVLNDATRNLLLSLWGDASLLAGAHAIGWRRVAWEAGGAPSEVPAPASVIAVSALAARLEARVLSRFGDRVRAVEGAAGDEHDFTLLSVGRGPVPEAYAFGERHQFGARTALCTSVRSRTLPDRAWLEATPDGWLFVCPRGDGFAIVQAVTPSSPAEPSAALGQLLRGSRIGSWLDGSVDETAISVFPIAPAAMAPPCGARWLAVGDTAVAFDPVSGDGTGQAVRGAILASAVIDALVRGIDAHVVLAHYRLRLERALLAHLSHCLRYYSTAVCREAFQPDIAVMQHALEREPSDASPYELVLRGTRLVRAEPASAPADVPWQG